MRDLPEIELNEKDGYAMMLASGWDTIKETFNLALDESFVNQLAQYKLQAQECGGYEQIGIGSLYFRLSSSGTKSALYVLQTEDYRVFIRHPKMDWCFSVEYSSKALWEKGIDAIRETILEAIATVANPRCSAEEAKDPANWQRISAAHFAFDFYSPEFTGEMTTDIFNKVVAPSGCKKAIHGETFGSWGVCDRVQTLTIGKKNNLQVQLYDKGLEISEISGKDWMLELWENSGWVRPEEGKPQDCWRFEIRMGADFLRNRQILTIFDLHNQLKLLLTEAIFNRRLVTPTDDSNRGRWPLHPLYTEAYKAVGKPLHVLPLGKLQTKTGNAMADTIEKGIAGSLRSLTVLRSNAPEITEEELQEVLDDVLKTLWSDIDHEQKAAQADLRYADLHYFKQESEDYYEETSNTQAA